MRGSFRLFTWLGIPVFLHWSLLFYPILILFDNQGQGGDWQTLLQRLLMFVVFFGCVLLHEYGHILAARRYGVGTQDVVLTAIGGVARLQQMPERPRQELVVAIAGPLVNVAIAVVLFVLFKTVLFRGDDWWIFQQYLSDLSDNSEYLPGSFEIPWWIAGLFDLFLLNVLMVAFNLIPAFPMDGGRVLRALLAMPFGRLRATQWATWVGQAIAVAFVGLGLWAGAYTLPVIGIFVFLTARTENSMVRLDTVLQQHHIRDVLRTQFTPLTTHDWMQTPIQLLQNGSSERNFLVFDLNEQPVGILTERSIRSAQQRRDFSAEVARYVRRPLEIVHEDESLRYVYFLTRQRNRPLLAVVDDESRLIGVVDGADLAAFVKLKGG